MSKKPKSAAAQELAHKRALSLSPERRREISRIANEAKAAKKKLLAQGPGTE